MQLKLRFMALLWRTVLSPFSIRLSPLSAHEERFLWCFLHSMMMIVWKMVSNWVAPATFVDRKVIFYGVSLRVNCLWCWWFHRFAYWKRRSVRFFSNKNHQSFMQKFFRAAACGHRYFLSLSLSLSLSLYLYFSLWRNLSLAKHLKVDNVASSICHVCGVGGKERLFQNPECRTHNPPAGGKSKTN